MSWASNLNPEDNWDLCKGCQVVEFGGWLLGVVPIKTSADSNNSGTAAAAAAQGDLTQHPNKATNGNCDDDDCDNNDDYEDTVEEENNDDDPLVVSKQQEAEFNDNDGVTDVNIEEDLSPSNTQTATIST